MQSPTIAGKPVPSRPQKPAGALAPTQWIIDEALAGDVICNIGQVDEPTKRALDKLVRVGTLLKWRGYWYPVAGACYGIGPPKSCWGLATKYGAAS